MFELNMGKQAHKQEVMKGGKQLEIKSSFRCRLLTCATTSSGILKWPADWRSATLHLPRKKTKILQSSIKQTNNKEKSIRQPGKKRSGSDKLTGWPRVSPTA